MAEDKTRYYWLKLNEDFFEDETIQYIEEQENGKEYALFYLKLCLKSLRKDGRVTRLVGSNFMPYDKKALAKATNTDPDTVTVALNLFKHIGLIELMESGEIYMSQLDEMVGSETEAAKRKRLQRADKTKTLPGPKEPDWDNVPDMSQDCPKNVAQSIELRVKSIELETEKEREKAERENNAAKSLNNFGQVIQSIERNITFNIGPKEQGRAKYWLQDTNENADLVLYAIERAKEKGVQREKGLGFIDHLLKAWTSAGITDPVNAKAFEESNDPANKKKPSNDYRNYV